MKNNSCTPQAARPKISKKISIAAVAGGDVVTKSAKARGGASRRRNKRASAWWRDISGPASIGHFAAHHCKAAYHR